MHFSVGVDVLAVVKGHERGQRDPLGNGHDIVEPTNNVEYKWSLSTDFNHPLINTDIIVAWDLDNVEVNETKIEDKQECDAIVEPDDELEGFGFVLRKIRDGDNWMMSRKDASRQHTVRIVALRELIHQTFAPLCDVKIHESSSVPTTKKKGAKRTRTR